MPLVKFFPSNEHQFSSHLLTGLHTTKAQKICFYIIKLNLCKIYRIYVLHPIHVTHESSGIGFYINFWDNSDVFFAKTTCSEEIFNPKQLQRFTYVHESCCGLQWNQDREMRLNYVFIVLP